MTASAFHPAYRHVTQALVGIRKKAGLTQRQLAALLNRERSFISRLESGERRLDLLEFFWICNACKTSPETELGEIYRRVRSHSRGTTS